MAISRRSFITGSAALISTRALAPSRASAAPQSAGGHIRLANPFGIGLDIDPQGGRYHVTIQDEKWFGNGLVSVLLDKRWYRSTDANYPPAAGESLPSERLALDHVDQSSGHDRWGDFDLVALTWKAGATPLVTGFRLYRDRPFLVFTQTFPQGFSAYASGNWTTPAVVFPQFLPDYSTNGDLYAWTSGGMFDHRFGYGNAASLGGTVDLLLLSDADYHAAILSPFANYLVATQQSTPVASRDETNSTKVAINCGIEGLVKDIPAGFEHAHILVAGQGINHTFRTWGDVLLEKAGKPIPSKYQGDTLKYPAYWDDYGGYYQTHRFKEVGYSTYEDIIVGIAEDARKHGLRIGSYQIQDEDQLRDHEGRFEFRPDLFPHGLHWLREKVDAPLEAYYCWLAPNGLYTSKYAHVATRGVGRTPGSSMGDVFYSLDYWRYTAQKVASWGDVALQHDFQSVYEGDPEMMSSIDKMNTYFKNMAKALGERGMLMHYCMQLPRNIMESTENPIMVTVQGSWDHHAYMTEPEPQHRDDDPYVWKHLLFTTAFYGAVGIWPSRDNIQSLADPNAYEDVLLANLLGGELQLSHRIGECDFELVRKTYREGDCLLLKADRPITPLDRCYVEGGVVGYTESRCNGRTWYYVLSLPPAGYLANFCPADLGVHGPSVVYDFETRSAAVKEADSNTPLRKDVKHEYFVIAPLLECGMAVIGDTEKFVTMADMRIKSVEPSAEGVRVQVLSDATHNPIITGYAAARPPRVSADDKTLDEVSSLKRLQRAAQGWFWDEQTHLWHVKLDFAGTTAMDAKPFSVHCKPQS